MRKENMSNPANMETPQPNEFSTSTASMADLANRARRETDQNKSTDYLREMSNRLGEAISLGAIDESALRESVKNTLVNSTWEDFYQNLGKAGGIEEDQALKTHGGRDYAQNNKLVGGVYAIHDSIRKQISAKAMLKVEGLTSENKLNWTDQDWKKVKDKMYPDSTYSIDEIKELYNIRERYANTDFASLIKLDVNHLIDLIKEPTPAEKEEQNRKLQEDLRLRESMKYQNERKQASPIAGMRFGGYFKDSEIEMYVPDYRMTPDPKTGERMSLQGFNIREKADRDLWVEKNYLAFCSRIGPSVIDNWKGQLDFYIHRDMWSAYQAIEKNTFVGLAEGSKEWQDADKFVTGLREDLRKTEERLTDLVSTRVMAVCMEDSGGSANDALAKLIGADHKGAPNSGNVDGLQDRIITEKAGAYLTALNHGSTRKAYDKLTSEMGIEFGLKRNGKVINRDIEFNKAGTKVDKRSRIGHVDISKRNRLTLDKNGNVVRKDVDFKQDRLYKSLTSGIGFNDWIEDVLNEEDLEYRVESEKARAAGREVPKRAGRNERWLAYRTACDLMLVDGKFTQWSFALAKQGVLKNDQGFNDMLKASENWSGDPAADLLLPTNLIRIKGAYQDEKGQRILGLVDRALRPDYLDDDSLDKILPVSFVGVGAKNSIRYHKIIDTFGGPLGNSIPSLDNRDGAQALMTAVEMWHQLNGNKELHKADGSVIMGRELSGRQLSELIRAKIEAALLDSPGMTFMDMIGKISSPEDLRSHPFGEGLQMLLGPKLDGSSGMLAKVAGGQLNFEFSRESTRILKKEFNRLYMNDDNNFRLAFANILNLLGLFLDMGILVTETGSKVLGESLELSAKKPRK